MRREELTQRVRELVAQGTGLKAELHRELREPLRIAIIGNGNIYSLAYRYVLAILSSELNFHGRPLLKVLATCDLIEERARDAMEELGAERFYINHSELLRELSDELDAVIVATPTYTHAEIVLDSLRSGLHVLVEKPIAHRVELAEVMVSEARSRGLVLMVGHTRRFDPRWRKVKEEILSGALGDVLFMRRAERAFLPFPETSWHWDLSRGGGVHLDVGIHALDLITWLLEEKPEEVRMDLRRVREESRRGAPDWAHITMRFPSGAIASAEVSWTHPRAFSALYSHLYIVGTKGKLVLDDEDTNPAIGVDEEGIWLPRYSTLASAPIDAFINEVTHFIDLVLGYEKPIITPEEGLELLKLIS